MNQPAKVSVDLSGVPETLLWPLWFRASESLKADSFFHDPMGVEIARRIDYDFRVFGKPNQWHAVRARFGDDLISDFLTRHPGATVVCLGEGLETQLWRVDDGLVNWLTVDLPESIEVRRRLLPEHPRNRLLACSALEPSWMDEVDGARGVFICAAGLLMYFSEAEVLELIRQISQRLPGAELFFDSIPPWLSRRSLRGMRMGGSYRVPPMPFGLALDQVQALVDRVPGLQLLRTTAYFEAYPERSPWWAAICKFPPLRNLAPGLIHVRASR
ncbi:class I SAM-dependent methyltransferase [Pseudomonas sp. LRF_L74]|uniref:class I SAM-dependent methyltransferase n=1 Tax=Pseudomonas sp. LRF_L74 TaxID=3369422 RepID=UPI003F618104